MVIFDDADEALVLNLQHFHLLAVLFQSSLQQPDPLILLQLTRAVAPVDHLQQVPKLLYRLLFLFQQTKVV